MVLMDRTATILLCADARPAAGAGHVQRCAAVAAFAAELAGPDAVELVILGPVGRLPLQPLTGVSTRMLDLDHVRERPGAILGSHGQAALVVLDCYPLTQESWLSGFRARHATIPIIAFDDGATPRPRHVLGTIRAGLAAEPRALDVARGRFDASGSAFIPIRPGLGPHRRPRREAQDGAPPHLLMALGAADQDQHAERIAAALARLDFDAQVVTVHGPMASPERARPGPDRRFTAVHSPPDFLERLADATLVVTGVGNTCHEILYMGVPLAAVAVAPEQVAAGEAIEGLGLGRYLGRVDEGDLDSVARGIRWCLEHPNDMDRRAAAGRAVVDGCGAERLARHLVTVAETYFQDRFGEEEVAEEFDRSASMATDEHEKARWGSQASMVNRIALARSKVDWARVDSWLDVGVGTGRSLVEVERIGRVERFVGVDLSAEMLRFASSRRFETPAVAFRLQSFVSPVVGEPFSLVTAFGVLQQCGLSLELALARLAELTSTGGQVFVTTKSSAWHRFLEPGFEPEGGHHWFSPERLHRACEWANLEVVETGSFDPAHELVSDDLSEHHSVYVLARKAGW
jgi:spore coat polysaccharide biosynthesis predicted glycosyltransferase SpsG